MKLMLKALFAGLFLALFALASVAADAAKPLRVVMQVSDADPARWNLVLANARNAQNDVGAKNIEVEIVAYGPGLGMLKDDSVAANKVQEAITAGVRFVACRNTMQAQHVSDAEIIPGVAYAQAGVIEIIRKQQEGWAYLRP